MQGERINISTLVSLIVFAAVQSAPDPDAARGESPPADAALQRESPPTGPWVPPQRVFRPGARYEPTIWRRGIYESVQVNVDAYGGNIPGDAANEPSLAVDPTDPNRMVIGWRQFNSVASDFREAGWAYSHDGGETWAFSDTLDPGVYGSDPVLEAGPNGVFYYVTINFDGGRVFRSTDGGVSWGSPIPFATGFLPDKPWMAVDRSTSTGRGNIYLLWTGSPLLRSTDGGDSFVAQGTSSWFQKFWGTLSTDTNGILYSVGGERGGPWVRRSDNAMDPLSTATVTVPVSTEIGWIVYGVYPNPGGLIGQPWVAPDPSTGPTANFVYVLASTPRVFGTINLWFARSSDDGARWSTPTQVTSHESLQWFGMMDVAPNGRIDALWNDTRNTGAVNLSELHYSFSLDGGENWSPAVPVSPVFDSRIGWPGGNDKLGDYYDLTSDARGVNVAYAATFNGEQDVYFLRIEQDCNFNEVPDHVEIAKGYAADCNDNLIPDECETFGDCTCDWIVTLADHAAFVECLTGPQSTIGNRQSTIPSCVCADSHRDGAVDLADFARLQRFLTAP